MAKIFSIGFKNGSFADRISGITGTPTAVNMVRSEKGMVCQGNGTTSTITLNQTVVLGTVYSFECYVKIVDNTNCAIGGFTDTSCPLLIYAGTKTLYNRDTVNQVSEVRTSLFDHNWHHVIVTRNGTSVIFYIDNVAGSTLTLASNNSISVNQLFSRNGLLWFKGFCGDINIYNHILTEKERASAYKDFLNSYPIVQEKYPNVVNKPMDLSREKDNTLEEERVTAQINALAGWSILGNNTEELVTDGYKVNYVDNASGASCLLTAVSGNLTSGFVTGDKFRVRVKIRTGSVTDVCNLSASAATYLGGTLTQAIPTALTTYEFDLVATGASPYLYFTNMSAGESAIIQVVSVKKLTGLVAAYNFIPSGNTLVDISGNNRPITLVGKYSSTKNGVQFSGRLDNCTIANFNSGSIWTLAFRLKQNVATGYYIGTLNGAAGKGIIYHTSVGGWSYYYGGGTGYQSFGDGTVSTNKWANYTFVSNGTTVSMYRDGVFINTVTPTDTSITYLTFNSFASGTEKVEWSDLRVYNRILTLNEIKSYHNSFVQPTLICDFSDEGADGVAKVPSGFVKQSGSFKIGEYRNGNLGNIAPFASGSPSAGFAKVGNTFVYTTNGVSSSIAYAVSGTIGKRYKIKYTILENPNSTIMNSTSGALFPSVVWDTTVGYHEYELTGLVAAIFSLRVTAGQPSGLILSNISVEEISPLPTFKPGTKYLECVTAGSVAIPSKQAYGTWEFDWYKGADANDFITFPINTTKAYLTGRGYFYEMSPAEGIAFGKFITGTPNALLVSASSYCTINTWYRIKLTRTLSGVFTTYIKGGIFGNRDWALISITGGAGTNPVTDNTYTTSEYCVFDIDAGDRIANIQFWDGIKQ